MKSKGIFLLFLIIVEILFPNLYGANIQVIKISDVVVDQKALTIDGRYGQHINGLAFQQDAVVTHKNYQYAAYYDALRHVCVARRKLPQGEWQIIRLTDYVFQGHDAHNVISMGLCPKDGTIHLAFDHHGHPLHYRVSRKGVATDPEKVEWEPSLFGPVISELEKGKPVKHLTYPRFLQTPGGAIQFYYRVGGSGGGDYVLIDYDPATTDTWQNTRIVNSGKGDFQDAFNKSPSRCAYENGYDYGSGGRLHTTWVWREQTQGANHDIMYAFSDDLGKTWRNNKGEIVGNSNALPKDQKVININSPDITAVPITRAYGLMNTQAQAVDSRDRIHVVMWHCTDETIKAAKTQPVECWGSPDARRYHHYWRDEKGVWHHTMLPWVAGNRPKLFMDKNDNAFLIFNAMSSSDKLDWGIYFSKGSLVIAAATPETGWTDWKIIHTEKGPFLNEMLGDIYLWKNEGILSILVQQSPEKPCVPTPLRILDFKFTQIE